MLVVDGLVHEAEGIAVVLAAAGEPVIVVVEALPLVLHVVATEVGEVTVVELRGLIQVATNLVEVEPDGASQLSAVEKDEELWLHTCVEVLLHQRGLVAVYAEMLEVLEFARQLFVILLDLRDNGVPRGGEVEERECGPALVQVLHELVQALRCLVILILVSQE